MKLIVTEEGQGVRIQDCSFSTSFLTVRDAASQDERQQRRQRGDGSERLQHAQVEPFRLADEAAELGLHQRAERQRRDRAGRARGLKREVG
jgi:hypothetical protein